MQSDGAESDPSLCSRVTVCAHSHHRAVKTAARATNVLWLNTVTLEQSDGGGSGASPEGALQASEGAGLIDRHHFATQ